MVPRRRTPLFKVHMPDTAVQAVASVLRSGLVAEGEQVGKFEERLCAWLETPNVVCVSDVSAALTVALALAGVGQGDDVLVSPMVCTATTMPIANVGARPRWLDVDPCTGMPDPAEIGRSITPRTRAVLAYHWSGDVARVEEVASEAARYGLPVIEDASNAFGASSRGRRIGSGTADFTAFSFRATKHVTTGEGGAVVCRTREDTEKAKRLRRYGIEQRSFRLSNGDLNPNSDIPVPGWSFAMTNIAGAIGNEQWVHVDRLVARHVENGRFYDETLLGVPGVTQLRRRADASSAYWTYSLRVERRNDLCEALAANAIVAQRLHVRNDKYSCFAASSGRELPGVEEFDTSNISIPCGWWVTNEDREYIVRKIVAGW